jgi:hypothetical protein
VSDRDPSVRELLTRVAGGWQIDDDRALSRLRDGVGSSPVAESDRSPRRATRLLTVAVGSLIGAVAVVVAVSSIGTSHRVAVPAHSGQAQSPGVIIGPGMPKPGSSLLGIAGTSSNDIWAVGESHGKTFDQSSLIEHWDGRGWSIVDAPDAGRLKAIVAVAPDDAWALGDRTLLHWDGATWTSVDIPKVPGASLSTMATSGSGDIWIAGVRPGPFIGHNTRGLSTVVMHLDGRRWTLTPTPNPGSRDNYVEGIVAVAPDDVWAAGYSSDLGKGSPEAQSLTMHWDGTSWTVVPSPDPSRSLNVIWGMGSDGGSGVWALGHYRAEDHHLHAFVLRWSGSAWEQIRVGGSSLWSATIVGGTSANDVWVVGSEPTSTTAVAHCEGSSCRMVIPPNSIEETTADGIFAASPDDAWIVGTTWVNGHATPFVDRWDGSTWAPVSVPTPVPGS